MKEKITVLIADDNQEFSQTLASYIDAQEDIKDKLIKDYELKNINLLNLKVLSKKYIEKSIQK